MPGALLQKLPTDTCAMSFRNIRPESTYNIQTGDGEQSITLLVPKCKQEGWHSLWSTVNTTSIWRALRAVESQFIPTIDQVLHIIVTGFWSSTEVRIHLANMLLMFTRCKCHCRWYFDLDHQHYETLGFDGGTMKSCFGKTGRGGTIFATLRTVSVTEDGVSSRLMGWPENTPRETAWLNGFKSLCWL